MYLKSLPFLEGSLGGVPVMSGFVEEEGSIYLAPLQENLPDLENLWDLLGPSYLLQTSPGSGLPIHLA